MSLDYSLPEAQEQAKPEQDRRELATRALKLIHHLIQEGDWKRNILEARRVYENQPPEVKMEMQELHPRLRNTLYRVISGV